MATPDEQLPPQLSPFDHKLQGYFGRFGIGANIQAFYLQSAMTPNQLQYIKLLNEIPGSERWAIRDLFQREVDQTRVTREIKPHFENEATVKFFSPITLTLLPINDDGTVAIENPRAYESREYIEGHEWEVLSRGEFYRFRHPTSNPGFSVLDWNSERSALVCIDGQHRVSTLRHIYDEAHHKKIQDFEQWRIPVIVASFKAADETHGVPRVLEVVRQLFTNINTEARTVSRSRQILLNDTRPNSIFTQELIQRSHLNDLNPIGRRDNEKIPLLCFNWRGSSIHDDADVEPLYSPDGLKSVIEIHDIIDNHVLDSDFSDQQKVCFERLFTMDEDLFHQINFNEQLPIGLADRFRRLANEDFVDGFANVFENFHPYREYIKALREFEDSLIHSDPTGVAQHSFDELRYGLNEKLTISHLDIEKQIGTINENIQQMKRTYLPRLVERAIGLRGVMCAFGELAREFAPEEGTFSWIRYSKVFTDLLNQAYSDNWINVEANHVNGVNFLQHIAIDHENRIINFKHKNVTRAIGSYITLIIAVYGIKETNEFVELIDDPEFFTSRIQNYRQLLVTGFKKQAKPLVIESNPEFSPVKIKQEVDRRAEEATEVRMQLFYEALYATNDGLDSLLGDV